ncbi:MAG: PDZ domain-containing protein [Candidatus Krumholzibacteriota bacterium]|nr:PDZ domain-containing protein [Candidatus Krumholzibacteriota bacterium]
MKRLILILCVAVATIAAPIAAHADVIVNGTVLATLGDEAVPAQDSREIRVEVHADADAAGGGDGTDVKKHIVVIDRKGAFLGIYFDEIDRKIRRERDYPKRDGVLVTGIIENSPAEKAGIEKGDIVYSFNGEEVEDGGHLVNLIAEREPGDEVPIVFYRDGKKHEIDLELGRRTQTARTWDEADVDLKIAELAPHFERIGGRCRVMVGGAGPGIGVKLHGLGKDLAGYFDVDGGALVLDVVEDSPAEKAGIKAGDVIVMIGDDEIGNPEDVIGILSDFEAGDDVGLTIVRKGRKEKVTVEIGENDGDVSWEFFGHGEDGKRERFIWRAPRIEKIEIPHLGIERKALEQELEELKMEMERLQKRLEKLEK